MKKNSLPGMYGRVCPQEVQCEEKCVFAKKGAPFAIGRLEGYVVDGEQAHLKPSGQPAQKALCSPKRELLSLMRKQEKPQNQVFGLEGI